MFKMFIFFHFVLGVNALCQPAPGSAIYDVERVNATGSGTCAAQNGGCCVMTDKGVQSELTASAVAPGLCSVILQTLYVV